VPYRSRRLKTGSLLFMSPPPAAKPYLGLDHRCGRPAWDVGAGKMSALPGEATEANGFYGRRAGTC